MNKIHVRKKRIDKKRCLEILGLFLFSILGFTFLMIFTSVPSFAQTEDEIELTRERESQPEKVMDIAGIKPGMIIGEIGAGGGFFTFRLAQRVGPNGRVVANDIDRRVLKILEEEARRRGFLNIETITGKTVDPKFPRGIKFDAIFLVNTFHDLERPVELANNLVPFLKPDAPFVILEYDEPRASEAKNYYGHWISTETLIERISPSVFKVELVDKSFVNWSLVILKVDPKKK